MKNIQPSSNKYPFINSPNFNERAQGSRTSILVLHYTADNFERTKETFLNPQSQVSSHYVIDIEGSIYEFVKEENRAWHAGSSFFNGINDVNSNSIGIEIVNPGYIEGKPLHPFPLAQQNAIAALSADIIKRYGIKPFCVIGHSDVAPMRKIDPGPVFPWNSFAADFNIGLFPTPEQAVHESPVGDAAALLAQYGYGYTQLKTLSNVQRAFQLHFNQEAWLKNVPFGGADIRILRALLNLKEKTAASR